LTPVDIRLNPIHHVAASAHRADLSLEFDTVVFFFFAEEADFRRGIRRVIKEEGIAV
jgi:hypothetical protein